MPKKSEETIFQYTENMVKQMIAMGITLDREHPERKKKDSPEYIASLVVDAVHELHNKGSGLKYK